jgi:membrane protein DedA with SNARE-associated domain
MPLEALILTYGYPALFAGTILEGEAVLILAGFLAHRGYLELPYVILVAFLGAFGSDQLFFQIGRRVGTAFLAKRPNWRERGAKVQKFLERHRIPIVLGFRFFYGIRSVTSLVIGISGFKVSFFMMLNAMSAFIWTGVFVSLGYALGALPDVCLSDVKRVELWVILGIILIVSLVGLYLFGKRFYGQKHDPHSGLLLAQGLDDRGETLRVFEDPEGF